MATIQRIKSRKNTNLRDIIIIDLAQFINDSQQQKHGIIVRIDANESNDQSKNRVVKRAWNHKKSQTLT